MNGGEVGIRTLDYCLCGSLLGSAVNAANWPLLWVGMIVAGSRLVRGAAG